MSVRPPHHVKACVTVFIPKYNTVYVRMLQEVINTMRVLAEIPHDSLGAYVISMARTASDVLAVVLLQRECGIKVRVVYARLGHPYETRNVNLRVM